MTDVAAPATMTDVGAKYREIEGRFLFSGVQALVRVPFDVVRQDRRRGLRTAGFVSGYQGSPLGTVDLELSRQRALADELDIRFRPGVNEELAATAVMGSQMIGTLPGALYEGVFGLWYGKAPGLDRATDALRHASYGGSSRHGGAIAAVGDDPAAKSSTLPSSSEYLLHDLHMPTFVPGNVQEVLDFGLHAAAMSRASGLWSSLRIVTAVADGTGSVEVAPDRVSTVQPRLEHDGALWIPTPQKGHMAYHSVDAQREIVEARWVLAGQYVAENAGINQITAEGGNRPWIGIAASGRTYYEVVEALRKLGLDRDELSELGVRLLRIGVVSPLDPGIVRVFAAGLEEIVVVEDSGPFLEVFVRNILYGTADAPRVLGRHDDEGKPLIAGYGSQVADALVGPLAARLHRRIPAERLRLQHRRAPISVVSVDPDSQRQPFFCSGCPHNTSTRVPDGSLVGAGIGCHSMVSLMDAERVGTVIGITQMGGEGAQWIGMEPFVDADHLVQNLGDGTLFHSGSLAIRAAVAAGSSITYKILYNSAVAMTGGQDAQGALSVPDLAAELLLEGVKRVIVTTEDVGKLRKTRLMPAVEVWHRDRLLEAQEVLSKVAGVTVLIHDQQCAAEKRRDRKRGRAVDPAMRVVINERVCEGCGDCGDVSNCLSVQPVETEFGRKTRIDQSSCNKDYSCVKGDCPSFLTVEPLKPSRWRRTTGRIERPPARSTPAIDDADLPEPTLIVPAEDATIRMPGIGGTGVVTVSQILGTAAVLDGKFVAGLDQTGFSQKAGAVVSDLRITARPVDGTNQASAGTVDLYLVFDLLVALAPKNLDGTDARRTVAVVSTSATPTGRMVTHTDASYPDTAAMLADLDAATRAYHHVELDAVELARGLFGNTATANILVVGAAFQNGCLPISAAAIERAIELNGVAVDANQAAFRWGRMWVHDAQRVRSALRAPGAASDDELAAELGELAAGELGQLLQIRVPELRRYQSDAYAQRYLTLVRRVADAEWAVEPSSGKLAQAVARSAFKLMAYKDEYEVARLHDEFAGAAVAAQIGDRSRISYNLHPPILRALGMRSKIRFGPLTGGIAMKALARGKRLRGTPFDPFGYAKVRRIERQLVEEYFDLMTRVAANLTADRLTPAIELAELPDMVRGYEAIKLANVARYHGEVARLRNLAGA